MAEVFFTVATGKSVAAGVAAAAVLTAAMAAFVIVVITSGIVCIGEGTGQQFGYPLIGVTGAAGVEPDPGFRQGHLGAGADAAADQAVYLLICQEAGPAHHGRCRWCPRPERRPPCLPLHHRA